MADQDVNLRQLKAFRAVMTGGSATAAARRLKISQPAISQQIAQLEQALGLTLFFRERGRLVPTPDADRLQAEVERVVSATEHMLSVVTQVRDGGHDALRIAVPESIASGMLPAILADFARSRSDVRFTIAVGHYDRIQELVGSEQADIGISRQPIDYPGTEEEPLITVKTVCVLPAAHPLASKKVITPEDLRHEPMVSLSRRLATSRTIRAFVQQGITPSIRVETHAAGIGCAFVAAGLGVTVMNALMAAQYRHLPLTIRPFEPATVYRYVLLTNRVSRSTETVRAFALHVRKAIDVALAEGGDAPPRPSPKPSRRRATATR